MDRRKILDEFAGVSYARVIAFDLGVSEATISRWLAGKTKPIGLYSQALKSKYPKLWEKINEEARIGG